MAAGRHFEKKYIYINFLINVKNMHSYGLFGMQNHALVLFMYFDIPMYQYQRWHQRWLPKYIETPIVFIFLLYTVSDISECAEFRMQHNFIFYLIPSFHIFDTYNLIEDVIQYG